MSLPLSLRLTTSMGYMSVNQLRGLTPFFYRREEGGKKVTWTTEHQVEDEGGATGVPNKIPSPEGRSFL